MTITVNKQEFAARLEELFALVEGGADVVVSNGTAPPIRFAVLEQPKPKRIAGLHAGRGWMVPDFDVPLLPEAGEVVCYRNGSYRGPYQHGFSQRGERLGDRGENGDKQDDASRHH